MGKKKALIRKKVIKYFKKLVKKHGTEFSIGLVSDVISDMVLNKLEKKSAENQKRKIKKKKESKKKK